MPGQSQKRWKRLGALEMKFVKTVGYTLLNHKQTEDI
jgi:hypothetical protein